jgi:hypothetical protein
MFRFGDPGGRMYTAAGTAAANILAHWTSLSATSAWSVSASNGRTTGSCLRMAQSNQNTAIFKTLTSQATLGIAFAFRSGGAQITSGPSMAGFYDTTAQVDLRLNSDFTLSVTRAGTVLGTTSSGLNLNSYAHIEFKVTFHPSAGTVDVWINGVNRLSLTGQNTRATANSSANAVYIGNPSINPNNQVGTWDYDDIIVYDGQATDANGNADITGPIGDCGLAWLLPTGAGTTTQFTPDTGSNFARVNEATPDGDTSYAESATVGNIDTYAMGDLAGTVTTIKSVASIQYAKKTDVGARGMKAELRSGGGNAAHATEIALGNSYLYYFSNWGRNPNNGSPADWTPTAVNALEAGQQVSS